MKDAASMRRISEERKRKHFINFFNLSIQKDGAKLYKAGRSKIFVTVSKQDIEIYISAGMLQRISENTYKMVYNEGQIRAIVKSRDNQICKYCGNEKKITLDHILPKSKGGKTIFSNLACACKRCNESKGDMYLSEFIVC